MHVFIILTALAIIVLIWAHWIEPNWLDVHRLDIFIPGLDPALEDFTILHLSDLHQCRFGPAQEKLLQAIGEFDYDMVALTGDILSFPKPYDYSPSAELLAGLKAPVYFVFGNHDYYHYETLTRALADSGVTILENSWGEMDFGDATLQIAGIHDPYRSRRDPGSLLQTDMEMALAGINPNRFILLLSHSPEALDKAARHKISLVLCGHTHGGQIKIPLLGAPLTGRGKYFDKYVQGLYRKDITQLFINRGLGTTAYPLRFLSRPEVAFIRLKNVD